MFSFSLLLGLQVRTTYGNVGMVVSAGAATAYVLRFVRKRRACPCTRLRRSGFPSGELVL